MPNGSPDFAETERPLLEQFFAPVADCLEHFGLAHNLLLTRYWPQEPCWDYMFRHPLGGVGRMMLYKAGEDLLYVQGQIGGASCREGGDVVGGEVWGQRRDGS